MILCCCYFTFHFCFWVSPQSAKKFVFLTNELLICISDILSRRYTAFPFFFKDSPKLVFVCCMSSFCVTVVVVVVVFVVVIVI